MYKQLKITSAELGYFNAFLHAFEEYRQTIWQNDSPTSQYTMLYHIYIRHSNTELMWNGIMLWFHFNRQFFCSVYI